MRAAASTMSHVDEQAELEKYREEVLSKARETMSKTILPMLKKT
jgi:arsenite-transporting ATPase